MQTVLVRSLGRSAGPRSAPRRRGLASVCALAALGAALQTLAASAQPASPGFDELLDKAARQGSVRVIVELRVDEPAPVSAEAIGRAQDLVLRDLAGADHRVLRRFSTIPFLGLEVSPEALRRLAASAVVVGIREDRILRPQGGTGSP